MGFVGFIGLALKYMKKRPCFSTYLRLKHKSYAFTLLCFTPKPLHKTFIGQLVLDECWSHEI